MYGAAPGPKGGKRLSRAQAFEILWPILSPQSGLARRILDHEPSRKGSSGRAATTPSGPASGDSVRLRHAVLQLLKVAFSAPGNPFVADKATTGEADEQMVHVCVSEGSYLRNEVT